MRTWNFMLSWAKKKIYSLSAWLQTTKTCFLVMKPKCYSLQILNSEQIKERYFSVITLRSVKIESCWDIKGPMHLNVLQYDMSQWMRFPTMWYVLPAKAQISLRIRTVWSEPLLIAWIFYECWATDRTSFGGSKLKRRLHRLDWVYTCQNVKCWKSRATAHIIEGQYSPILVL